MTIEDHEDDYDDSLPRPTLAWRVGATFEWILSYIGHWLGRLVEFFEWCGYHLFVITAFLVSPWRWIQKEEAVADLTDSADETLPKEQSSFAESSERIFANVFGVIGHCVSTAFRVLVPQKLIEKIEAAQHAVVFRTLDFVLRFGERTGELAARLFPRRLFWPFYWLFGAVLDMLDFSAQWWYSRNFAKLLWALPAIVLLLPLCGSLMLSLRYSTPKRISHYETVLATAEDEGDTDTATLYRTKLTQLGFEHLDIVEFRAALELGEQEKFSVAYDRMRKIAPEDEPGLLEAHVWIAGALLNRHIDDDDPWRLLEIHLNHALTLDDENPLAKRFLAELLLHKGERAKAMKIMEETVRFFPSFHPDLAHLYRIEGNELKSKFHARRAISHYLDIKKQQKKHQPDDQKHPGQWTPRGYLRIAESYGLIEDRIAELQVLQEAAATYPDDKALESSLIQTLISRIAIADLRAADARQWIETVCRKIPNQRVVVAVLGKGLISGDPHTEQLVEELREKKLLSSDVFERVGDTYMSISQFEKAMEFYVKTCELNPDAGFALNNMAWVWGNVEPTQTDKAIAAADHAIELNPDPRFHETRGQILLKLERWDEAAKDLERALNGTVPNVKEVHLSLANCYEAMGNVEQAEAHRATAKVR